MKKAKKVLLILLAIVLLIGCTIGGTIAYLMTATPAVENTFVAGAIGTLTLTEADTDSEAEGEQHNYTIIPGKPITKNPQVTYTPATSNDVGSVYIFVKVTDDDWTYAENKFSQGGLSWTVAEGFNTPADAWAQAQSASPSAN